MVSPPDDRDPARVRQERLRLEDWRRRLIDLSGRNRLIRFPPTRNGALPIESPSTRQLLADLERREPWPIYLAEENEAPARPPLIGSEPEPILPPRPPKSGEIVTGERDPKALRRRLERLARRSTSEYEDKPIRVLFLAAGFLDWHDPKRQEAVSSPLVLVPVELKRETAKRPYQLFLAADEDVVVNPALTIKLERDLGLDVPGDWGWEDKPIAEELDEIRGAVAPRGWTVREDAVIGIFAFHKLVMYRDLLDNEEQVLAHPMVRALSTGSREAMRDGGFGGEVPDAHELDDVQAPEDSYSILDADASQRRCVEAAKRSVSFVMQGPPGTGKSQTIANIIAESLGQGKRVLFISEKAAALDVVFNRLHGRGLSEFCLKLHGDAAKRHEVVSDLATSLLSEPVPQRAPSTEELRRLSDLRRRLTRFVKLLHAPSPELLGDTPRQVYERLAGLHDAPLGTDAPRAKPTVSDALQAELREGEEVFSRFVGEPWRVATEADFPWRGYAAASFGPELSVEISREVAAVARAANELGSSAQGFAARLGISKPSTHRATRELIDLGQHLERAPNIDQDWLAPGASIEVAALAERAENGHTARDAALATFQAVLPGSDLASFPAGLQQELRVAVRTLEQRMGRTATWESQLPSQLATLTAFVRDSGSRIEGLGSSLREVGGMLGQPIVSATLGEAERVVELARLAYATETRPDPAWLGTAGLERAKETLADLGPGLREYASSRAAILEEYEPSVFELEAALLAGRFETVHVGPFAKLKGTYRRDAKALKATRKDGRLPADPAGDLRSIAHVNQLGSYLDSQRERASRAFGALDHGRETSPDAIARAIGVAEPPAA